MVCAEAFALGQHGIAGLVGQASPLGYLTSRFWSPSVMWSIDLVIVLAGLSIGNYLGGVLADRRPGRATLSYQFLASAIAAGLDGRERTLCLTLGALAELEMAFGAEDLVALTGRFESGRLSARDIVKIIGCGLRGAGNDVRDDAVAAMRPLVEEALLRGKSLAVAPEGTRSGTGRLGPFKKGAFRLAMAGGVPVVPIVFRNANDVWPLGTQFMRPGTVDVVVHPPIPTDDWTDDDLDQRIADVRRLYLDTLADWPAR